MDIIGIAGLAISAASLLVMIFGINLGKKALHGKTTVIGKEAEERFAAMKNKLPQDSLFEDGPYQGGSKATPQLEIERMTFDAFSMPRQWERFKKTVRYYYKDGGGIQVKAWQI
jgi:hypothetical protein